MARICPLCSGSGGNSTYISFGDGAILVDAGASCKSLLESVAAVGSIDALRAVAITHEHTDHIKGLKTLLKKVKAPLIASSGTIAALEKADVLPADVEVVVADSEQIDLGGFVLSRFATSHDTEGSSGYTLYDGNTKIAVCTDLGIVTDDVRVALSGSSAILLESNHDVEMLKRGPYPPQLKLRILSERGHLSNNACAEELPALLKSGTTRIILGHLSMHNNTPILAAAAARAALADIGAKEGLDYILKVAKPCISEAVTV
ncbi:MAG: MBL fold metallo-hydrolase [Acutalibacteraceae bacterium]|nr:MBL fold metallo-hydrolase [Acutalibacteraceae bacterium]